MFNKIQFYRGEKLQLTDFIVDLTRSVFVGKTERDASIPYGETVPLDEGDEQLIGLRVQLGGPSV